MLFNSTVFVAFLFVTLALYWGLASTARRQWLLVVASLFFYGWWDYRFVPLLGYVALVAYLGARAIEHWPERGKRWVGVALVLLLGPLAFFKYTHFLLSAAGDLAQALGFEFETARPTILLPIGVSFYTFHGISYVVDVYRGKLAGAQSLRVVALYIVFFPQLVAGPIVRGATFIPQLFDKLTLSTRDIVVGMKFVLIGVIYKGIFADQIAPLVDPIFDAPEKYDNVSVALAALGFYSQIYFDFVGYSTMAIGISRWFGFKLPRNFDLPYRARSITEFWRRWHISLSSWLRDYLYITLGGNRGVPLSQYRNLLLTMLLGGLWHGASYNFVLWGGLHGMALALHKLWATRFPWVGSAALLGARAALGWLLTQIFVLALWVPFRAANFEDTRNVLEALTFVRPDEGLKHADLPLTLFVLPLVADHVFTYNTAYLSGVRAALAGRAREHLPAGVRTQLVVVVLGLCFALALVYVQLEVQNFIYFQF